MIGLLLGCGLRRSETVNLRLDQLQSRQNHWVIVDMLGKGEDCEQFLCHAGVNV
jgi:integrase